MHRTLPLYRLLIWPLVIALCTPQAFGWGEDGHQAINREAVKNLPPDMPRFLKSAASRVAYLGPEPDRWREDSEFSLKHSQEPDHYIDFEPIAGLELPRDRYQFFRALEQRRAADPKHADVLYPEKVGLQPYIVAEIYGRLKVAFREYRKAEAEGRSTAAIRPNIVLYMGWLGHYVADGSNPLHTTVNYNGWVQQPNPHSYRAAPGIHSKMETAFVSANLDRLAFHDLVAPPRVLNDPWRDYLAYLKDSHKLVERVYQLDLQNGFRGEGTAESREFIRQRLAAGASMLRDLWYTAWIESGKELRRN